MLNSESISPNAKQRKEAENSKTHISFLNAQITKANERLLDEKNKTSVLRKANASFKLRQVELEAENSSQKNLFNQNQLLTQELIEIREKCSSQQQKLEKLKKTNESCETELKYFESLIEESTIDSTESQRQLNLILPEFLQLQKNEANFLLKIKELCSEVCGLKDEIERLNETRMMDLVELRQCSIDDYKVGDDSLLLLDNNEIIGKSLSMEFGDLELGKGKVLCEAGVQTDFESFEDLEDEKFGLMRLSLDNLILEFESIMKSKNTLENQIKEISTKNNTITSQSNLQKSSIKQLQLNLNIAKNEIKSVQPQITYILNETKKESSKSKLQTQKAINRLTTIPSSPKKNMLISINDSPPPPPQQQQRNPKHIAANLHLPKNKYPFVGPPSILSLLSGIIIGILAFQMYNQHVLVSNEIALVEEQQPKVNVGCFAEFEGAGFRAGVGRGVYLQFFDVRGLGKRVFGVGDYIVPT